MRAVSPGNEEADDDGLGPVTPSGRRYVARVAPTTLRNAARGYGRFLCCLAEAGLLDPDMRPEERVNPRTANMFVAAMKACDNSPATRVARLWELHSAMAILAPGSDFSWLRSPGGLCLWSLVPETEPRELPAGAHDVIRWCRELLDTAAARSPGIERAVAYRNALIIGLLATRAPRLRSLALMRIGRQFLWESDRFRIVFRPEDTKSHKRLEYDLPEWLCPAMRQYLEAERPPLLAGRNEDHLWIGQAGGPLGQRGVEQVIRRAMKARFGKAFGPHAFRAIATTALAEGDPRNPGAAAALLGHSHG
ncbi:MAG: tyrosine-type recombinase/integrase, partial [Chloroflexota bacterium]